MRNNINSKISQIISVAKGLPRFDFDDLSSIEKDKKVLEVKKDPEKFVNEMEDLKNKTVKTEQDCYFSRSRKAV